MTLSAPDAGAGRRDRKTKGDLVFMGPPGSGKGTQAQTLRGEGIVQLSTGELFRDNIKRGTALGQKAKSFIDRGDYVPDDVTVDMVREWLRGISNETRIVFDGFPRTVAQADELDALLGEFGRKVASVILIDAPRDELLQRLTKRSQEQGRTDDTPAVIGRRLDVYKEQTQPVVDHYKRKALVHLVDGLGPREEVTKRLRKAMAE